MKFIDEVSVKVHGGDGGRGAISFRREAHVPRGGPDGGDGGNGGAVIFVAKNNLNTLVDFAMNPSLIAKSGSPGAENQKTGANGTNLECPVPLGTQVFFEDALVADLSEEGARWIAARGGKGGKGNTHYKSASNQTPDYAQSGIAGDARTLTLVLKSIADVGLVGFPNVGKSTLLSAVSRSHAKVADYPFTTLTPNLGVVLVDAENRYVIADVPGLVGGAHKGRGLGSQFLKHLERTKVLAQIIDVSIDSDGKKLDLSQLQDDEAIIEAARSQMEQIETELKGYSERLISKPRLLIFTKGDLEINERAYALLKDSLSIENMIVSSHTKSNLDALKYKLFELINDGTEDSNCVN